MGLRLRPDMTGVVGADSETFVEVRLVDAPERTGLPALAPVDHNHRDDGGVAEADGPSKIRVPAVSTPTVLPVVSGASGSRGPTLLPRAGWVLSIARLELPLLPEATAERRPRSPWPRMRLPIF